MERQPLEDSAQYHALAVAGTIGYVGKATWM